jgi:uncharacterized delta-60 repeat protein
MATTPDGSVVVAGAADSPDSCQKVVVVVWRLLPSGAPDPGFGDGRYSAAVDPDICGVTTMSFDGQGRPVVLYSTAPQPDTPVCALERFGADGSTIDVPYHLHANAVFTAAPFAGDDCLTAVALADGRVIVVGRHRVFRLAADGTLDTSYGTAGSTVLDGYSPTGTLSAARTADGGLILGGDTFDGHGYRFMLTRLTPDGAVDPTFGVGGRAVVGFADVAPEPAGPENTDHLSAVHVRSDGTIVAVGTTPVGLALVRLTAAGTPDPAFTADGRVVIGSPAVTWTTTSSVAEQTAVLPSGDLVVAFGTVVAQPVELVRLDLT